MLELLINYARTHGLTIEPGFKPKTVRWAIVCDKDGHFSNVQELGKTDEKYNPGRLFDVCPDLSQSEMKAGGQGCRHFLVDNVEVVTLMGKKGDLRSDTTMKKADREKALAKHEFFKSLLKQSANAIREAPVLVKLLDSGKSLSRIQRAFADQPFRPTDRVTFAIAGRTPMFLVEDKVWHNWWRTFRRSLAERRAEKKKASKKGSSAHLDRMRSFSSGDFVVPTPVHPKIEGLADVGGIAMGDALVSFKQESFQSYFLPQATNAAVSEEMAAAYRAGLNDIIKTHSQMIAGAKVVHWYAGSTEVIREEDPMAFLEESTDETEKERNALHRAREFLKALESGSRPRLRELEKYRFYAMVLSANAGRVVTHDWIEGQFGDLARSVVKWYENLEIVSINSIHSANSPRIERVITCMLPPRGKNQKYKDWIKPIGEERSQLWQAAISQKAPFPHKVLGRLVPLHQNFVLSGDLQDALDEKSNNRAKNLSLLYARMGLLRAYHIRKGDKDMQPYLNEDHPSPAYHCGRLMAVYADLQRAALGDVGAGVVQRYYAAASATPALIFGRLSRGGQFHLNKLEGGLAYWYEQRLSSIWVKIKDNMPKTLTLEQQSLFALGYYQQMAAPKKSEKDQTTETQEKKGE